MQPPRQSRNIALRPTPLAACMAALFALSAPTAMAATWTVNTCSEANSGVGTTGTLRYAVANAATGDTVDMTGLACSTISLQTGAITVNQADLTLQGPGMNNLTISGKYNGTTEADRVINHQGTGQLNVYDLAVTWGDLSSSTANANGGCIYSKGSVYLKRVGAYFCQASVTGAHNAAGGAIFTTGNLRLKYSNISLNTASGGSGAGAFGGGAHVDGTFSSKYSTISENSASAASGTSGNGGGLHLLGSATINGSTISGNTSGRNQGGIDLFNSSPSALTATITNSTISGNHANDFTGGVYANTGTLTLSNSTIAFNTAGKGRLGSSFPFTYYAPGVSTSATFGSMAVTLQSSLIANNTYGTASEYDLSVAGTSTNTITFNAAPAKNLVRATFANVPSDTIKIACPLLGPLRNNGGPTQTHALLSHSPGIDQGNNTAALNEDQRGVFFDAMPYPYPRVSGSQADIGAYEVQQGDIIFNNGFEGCPLLF